MPSLNVSRAAQNLSRVAWNRAAKLVRDLTRRGRRLRKDARETGKSARAQVKGTLVAGRDASIAAYAGTIRATRYWNRVRSRTLPRVGRDLSVRWELWNAARGSQPIIVGPWLGEVGYEVLYWVPFLRWFADHYRVDRSRLVVVSRGGVRSWYHGISERYVELLDVFTPAEFQARNAARQESGEQKQRGLGAFDIAILERLRALPGLADATVCHPSAMFRLLRQFWLGNESLEYLLEHLRFARMTPAARLDLPLPPSYVAMKFYTGRALPDTDATRHALRSIVKRVAARRPIVMLNTGLTLDEHQEFLFRDIEGVTSSAAWLTPQNNLGVQTEIIARAEQFVGTCGSVAWLAPMLGTETLAVYEDDYFLRPHLYVASHAYHSMKAARFTPADLHALAATELPQPVNATPAAP